MNKEDGDQRGPYLNPNTDYEFVVWDSPEGRATMKKELAKVRARQKEIDRRKANGEPWDDF